MFRMYGNLISSWDKWGRVLSFYTNEFSPACSLQ